MSKKILIDWLTFTLGLEEFFDVQTAEVSPEHMHFDDGFVLDQTLHFLGLDPDLGDKFVSCTGRFGYLHQLNCGMGNSGGGIRILWGGMGTICFDFTGQGCRLYEELVPEMEWLDTIRRVQKFRRHNFSRMDIACDTFGELQMKHIFRYTDEHRYISRWKLEPDKRSGRTEIIEFGSMKSRTMLCIYNKTLERRANVDKNVEIPENWVRCELRMRGEAIDSFIREWNACGDVSAVYFGIIANQHRFVKKRPGSETNLERLETVAWWRKFLENAQPMRLLYKGGLSYNLESLERYVFQQAGSSICTWLVASDWDVDGLLKTVAGRKMNARQEALIKAISIKDFDRAKRRIIK